MGEKKTEFKLRPPALDDYETFDEYKTEVLMWCNFSNDKPEEQAPIIAWALPKKHHTKIREKVFANVAAKDLKQADGVTTLLEYMNKHLGKEEIDSAWENFDNFESFSRRSQTMEDFISQFDQLRSKLVKSGMEFPAPILAFKVLKAANISDQDRKIVLTGVNYKSKDTMYDDAKKSLKKFISDKPSSNEAITVMATEHEHSRDVPYRRRYGRDQRKSGSGSKDSKLNPIRDGKRMLCNKCGSYRHLYAKCPEKVNFVEDGEQDRDEEAEDEPCLVASSTDDISTVTSFVVQADEELGLSQYAVLDTACSSTVCGQVWLDDYMGCLSQDDKKKVVKRPSDRKFRFGGGELLKSKGNYVIPASLAGKGINISCDVVDSNIPLLLSKKSMKTAKIKINMDTDIAEVYGTQVKLDVTSSGHYCIYVGRSDEFTVESVCSATSEKTSKQKLEKLHRMFAHPTPDRLKNLMKDAGCWDGDMQATLDSVQSECEVCKIYARTPRKPTVSMPMASDFNETVAMDLKKWNNRWILHIIDMWSRFTISVFIDRKRPSDVVDKLLLHWVGAGYGLMKSILTDNGGEFSAEEIREVCSILHVEVLTTAAESPFQNGLCERNHGVVDSMLLKLVEQCPDTPVEVLLAWANNAKNSLQMCNGFSSYQLVLGRNPSIPNTFDEQLPGLDGHTTSKTLAKHLNSLHCARTAFIEAEASERVRRALRGKIRYGDKILYSKGDRVFYKRDGKNKWLGPAKVLFQDKQVIFLRHGGIIVRVSPSRIVKVTEQFKQAASTEPGPTNRGHEFEQNRVQPNVDDVEIPDAHENFLFEFQRDSTPENETISDRDENDQQRDPGNTVDPQAEPEVEIPHPDPTPRRSNRTTTRPDYAKLHNVGREEAFVTYVPRNTEERELCKAAKISELDNWRKFQVYDVVDDVGQSAISTRWVVTEKQLEDNSKKVKARLVARGFEESDKVQSDSPTATKETVRAMLGLSSTLHWKCHTIDIRAAFLQGKKLDRDVFLIPPPEAEMDGKLWKLRLAVYGLNDASRAWYFSVRDELVKLGCTQSTIDMAMFTWQIDGEISGMFVMHVDDFIWSGTDAFKTNVIDTFNQKFEIGKEAHGAFRYIGLDIYHDEDYIEMSQNQYIQDDIQPIPITSERSHQKHEAVTEKERDALRKTIGKLNWVATQTRPDISFETLELSTSVKDAKVEDLIRANKAVKSLKSDTCVLRFPRLGDVGKLRLYVYSDASYANLRDGYSSAGGHVIFMVGENGASCTLSWRSTKIRRVVRSTIAAETLSLVNALDEAIYLRHLLRGVLGYDMAIHCCVDNKSLVENLHSTKLVHERKLRIDIAELKQMIERGEVNTITWVDSKSQLADCLTKKGAAAIKLREAVSNCRDVIL